MNIWHCEICNVSLKQKSKYSHLKSKKHLRNEETKSEDCIICCESSNIFEKCKGCNQEWCIKCDKNIFECPYCRRSIDGRQDQSIQQKRENYEWQINDEVFRSNLNTRALDSLLGLLIYNIIYND